MSQAVNIKPSVTASFTLPLRNFKSGNQPEAAQESELANVETRECCNDDESADRFKIFGRKKRKASNNTTDTEITQVATVASSEGRPAFGANLRRMQSPLKLRNRAKIIWNAGCEVWRAAGAPTEERVRALDPRFTQGYFGKSRQAVSSLSLLSQTQVILAEESWHAFSGFYSPNVERLDPFDAKRASGIEGSVKEGGEETLEEARKRLDVLLSQSPMDEMDIDEWRSQMSETKASSSCSSPSLKPKDSAISILRDPDDCHIMMAILLECVRRFEKQRLFEDYQAYLPIALGKRPCYRNTFQLLLERGSQYNELLLELNLEALNLCNTSLRGSALLSFDCLPSSIINSLPTPLMNTISREVKSLHRDGKCASITTYHILLLVQKYVGMTNPRFCIGMLNMDLNDMEELEARSGDRSKHENGGFQRLEETNRPRQLYEIMREDLRILGWVSAHQKNKSGTSRLLGIAIKTAIRELERTVGENEEESGQAPLIPTKAWRDKGILGALKARAL